jgi:superfamily I DNA/RNA helicase
VSDHFERQLGAAVDAVVTSRTAKKIVVAGPGTGKTWLFKRLLEADAGEPDAYLVLTFIRCLATVSPIVIAGDDDQALYSQLRNSSPQFIRDVYSGGEYQPFPLPFCMRCTEPIVTAVEDIIRRARAVGKLEGRISKPYLFYPPKKGPDSELYPRIKLVKTTVQSNRVNYFGRYVEQQILQIPPEDIEEAHDGHFPSVLVIGPSQYLKQIKEYLENNGHACQAGEGDDPMELQRKEALQLLQEDSNSNLGWRIVLETDQPSFYLDVTRKAIEEKSPLVDLVPEEYQARILSETGQLPEERETDTRQDETDEDLVIKLTSFEGSKGLAAQHVFIVGLHAGDLPRDVNNVTDLEICKFLVALTRTRKQCHILHTQRWSGQVKRPSIFLQWIRRERFEPIEVNKSYWE